MKSRKKKVKDYSKSMRIGIIILFIFAFIILVDKQQNKEEILGDILDNSSFRTIPSKQIAVRDLSAIYPRYYVFYFDTTDNTFIVHSFNYYQTDSQYELEFSNHLKYIVDYDYSDYMIRYVYKNGVGNYADMFEEISSIIDSDNYQVY